MNVDTRSTTCKKANAKNYRTNQRNKQQIFTFLVKQDPRLSVPHIRFRHAHRQHDLLRGRMSRRQNARTTAKRRLVLDKALAKEYRLHTTRNQLQNGSVQQ